MSREVHMGLEVVLMFLLAGMAGFAAIGGCLSYLKRRSPLEGCALGALLGPIGLVMELGKPCGHRPMVDQGAWNSFRSLVEHQSGETQLISVPVSVPARPTRSLPAATHDQSRSA